MHEDSIDEITGTTNNHNGDMRLYQRTTAPGYGLNANEGEVQLSNFRSGLSVVLNPMYVSFVSNLRSETKYRIDLGALTLGVLSPSFNSLQYTVQGLTT